ncbi:replication initiator protein A [Enterococcus lactis]|uniref:Replication protein n=2 Tax=Enterococcus faecalis TaxID=1351 RepID=A0A4Y6I0N1_ENTFL|nr:replication initiator protein A [Enterococcus faecalis]QDF62780.1 replication protein [Enterococcus faecalis]
MSEFNFIQSQRAYETKFFQFPQVLLYGKQYKQLSDSAKLGYMVLRDRLDYSLQNNWIDEQNRVYFIFTNDELHKIFGWGNTKISKVKKELQEANLLYQVNLGFDPKKKKNLPNRLYLSDLEVTATDVYMKHNFSSETAESLDNSGHSQMGRRQENISTAESLDNSGHSQMGRRQETAESLDNRGHSQMGHNLYNTNSLDTNRYNIDTEELDFSTENYSKSEIQKQNQDLIEHAKYYLSSINKAGAKEDGFGGLALNDTTIDLIAHWVRTPKQMHKFIGIILNAKRRVEEELRNQGFSSHYTFLDENEELQSEIENTVRRYFNALRNDDKHIRNQENYLFITMRNMLEQVLLQSFKSTIK